MATLERLAGFDREYRLCLQDLELVGKLREDQLVERVRALNGAVRHLAAAAAELVGANR